MRARKFFRSLLGPNERSVETDKIRDVVNAAMTNGELVRFAYGGGSSPGLSREAVISSVAEEHFRAIAVGEREKDFLFRRVMWLELSDGARYTNRSPEICADPPVGFSAAEFETENLGVYVVDLQSEFETTGWFVESDERSMSVHTRFKNGTPKKTPSVSIGYAAPSRTYWDVDVGDIVTVSVERTKLHRPWRVSSWRYKEAKAFGILRRAMSEFVCEVRACKPEASFAIGYESWKKVSPSSDKS